MFSLTVVILCIFSFQNAQSQLSNLVSYTITDPSTGLVLQNSNGIVRPSQPANYNDLLSLSTAIAQTWNFNQGVNNPSQITNLAAIGSSLSVAVCSEGAIVQFTSGTSNRVWQYNAATRLITNNCNNNLALYVNSNNNVVLGNVASGTTTQFDVSPL